MQKQRKTKKKNRKKKNEDKRQKKKGKKRNRNNKKNERSQKHKQNASMTEKRKKNHSDPIYTDPIKNFPNRSDDLIRFSIAKLKINSPKILHIKFWRIFWCNVITSVTSKYSQEFNLLY